MRITSIDALRGLAILGILIMNIGFHVNIINGYAPFETSPLSDEIIFFLQTVFADGRFRSLFCILFGVGLAIQYESCIKKGWRPRDFLKSRLNWLLIFGLLHALFIFGGDILMMYSIAGLLMLSRLHYTNEEMFSKGVRLLIFGCVMMLAFGAMILLFNESPTLRNSEDVQEMIAFWNKGYLYQMSAQFGFSVFITFIISPISILWQVMGLMMLGVYLYRTGFFTRGLTSTALTKVSVAAVVTTGLALAPQLIMEDYNRDMVPLLSSISAIFVALLYAHLIVTACKQDGWLINALSRCGKMAFTLYLLQSICMAILFRAVIPLYEPDFQQTVTMLDLSIITVLFTVVQVALAWWLIGSGRQGLFEILWRKAYLRSFAKKQKRYESTPNVKSTSGAGKVEDIETESNTDPVLPSEKSVEQISPSKNKS